MTIDRQNLTIETNGNHNDAGRLLAALGFRCRPCRGLSPRSTTFRGYFAVIDAQGREWHVI